MKTKDLKTEPVTIEATVSQQPAQTEALELQKVQQYTPPASINAEDPVGLFKLAIETKAGADTLERVMAVRRELRAEKAKDAFFHAMSEFQDKCPPIVKAKGVPDRSGKIAYSYAPLESIIKIVKPLLRELGFSYAFDTDVDSQPGWVIAKCIVTHCDGHSETYKSKFPLGTKTAIMSDTQAYSAALTFACRRVFCHALGIVTEGEDKDGQGQPAKPAGPSTMAPDSMDAREAAKELWGLLAEHRGTEKNWNAANTYLRDMGLLGEEEDGMPHVPAKRIQEIVKEIKERQ